MGLEIKQYAHVPQFVQAVQVTAENMQEVADWCEGNIFKSEMSDQPNYIKVPVARPVSSRQSIAFVEDWVLRTNVGWKVYTAKSFVKNFILPQDVFDPIKE